LPIRYSRIALVRDAAPDAVINAAACTAVDQAQGEAERAHRVNARAPGRHCGLLGERGVPLVH
jgi:dTDP-4-dehydrorhamnose reductase